MNDATAKLGKSKGRTIHYVPWQTTGLRLALHPILTEFILGIKVKKDGKLIRSSVLSNHYHRRTEFTEKISNSPMKKFRPTFSLKVSIYRHFLPLPPRTENSSSLRFEKPLCNPTLQIAYTRTYICLFSKTGNPYDNACTESLHFHTK